MEWDSKRAAGSRRGPVVMRSAKSSSPQPWACSSISSSDRFLPSYDNMLDGWKEREHENSESLVCNGCLQQASQRSPLLSPTQKSGSKIVFPQVLTRCLVSGKKVYCSTAFHTSVKWDETNSSERIRMCMMFLDFYGQASGDILLDSAHSTSADIVPGVVQTAAVPADVVHIRKTDPYQGSESHKGLLLSLAGAAGMRLICPPLQLPLLEMLLFSHQQLSTRTRGKGVENGSSWRVGLNLGLTILRPFCGSLVRRCLTALLFVSEMRSKNNSARPAASSMPEFYSVVQFENEFLNKNEFSICQTEDGSFRKETDRDADRFLWKNGALRGVDERFVDRCRKCAPIGTQPPHNVYCFRESNSSIDFELECDSLNWPEWSSETVKLFAAWLAENGHDSINRLRLSECCLKPCKRHCMPHIPGFRLRSGSLTRSGQSEYVDTGENSDFTSIFFKVAHADESCLSSRTHTDIAFLQTEAQLPVKSASDGKSTYLTHGTSPGKVKKHSSVSDEWGYSSSEQLREDGFDNASRCNLRPEARPTGVLEKDRKSRLSASQDYISGCSISERIEMSGGGVDTLPDSGSSRTRFVENFDSNRVNSPHDSSQRDSLNKSSSCLLEHRNTLEANVESLSENFESATAFSRKVESNQNDLFRTLSLEAELFRENSGIGEVYPFNPFADHPTCIDLRQRRHSHGDQIYIDLKDLLPPPWGQLIFWHGHCKEGFPTLCVLLGKAVRELPSQELRHFIAVTVSHLEYAEVNFFKKGVKQMNILMDLEGLGFMRLPPMNILSSIGAVLNRDYAGRGGWIMLINAPMMLGFVISTIQSIILRPAYNKGAVIDSSFRGFLEGKERIMTMGGKYKSVLQNLFDADMLPSFLGGDCNCGSVGSHCKRGVDFLREFSNTYSHIQNGHYQYPIAV